MSQKAPSEAGDTRTEFGERVSEARRNAGLTQRDLAARLGLSLWSIDQLERGKRHFPISLVDIARATNVPPGSFEQSSVSELHVPALEHRQVAAPAARSARSGLRHLVLGCFALLVLVRFFTEVVPVVPRAANFVDIPILVALGVAAMALSLIHI